MKPMARSTTRCSGTAYSWSKWVAPTSRISFVFLFATARRTQTSWHGSDGKAPKPPEPPTPRGTIETTDVTHATDADLGHKPPRVATDAERTVAEAFALEQLRSDQSERLTRIAERDIVFDGYLIPAGSYVRVCLWESHNEPATFAEPDRFHPDRFLGAMPPNDQFAPFGVDHHQCPFGGATIRLATAFLRVLATEFELTLLNDGPAVRGPYHWEPSRRLAVNVCPFAPGEKPA